MVVLINESQYHRIFEQSYNFDMKVGAQNQPSDYLGKGGDFERSRNYYDAKIMRGPKKGTTLDEAMETFREGLFSPTGMAIEAFLTGFGFGAPLVMGAYAGILAYDIYKSINGETDWFNIITDFLGLVTSGVVSGVFAPFIKWGKGKFNSIRKFFEWVKTTNIWKTLKPYLVGLASKISNFSKWLATGIKWVADNTGLTFLLKVSATIISTFAKIANQILEAVGEVVGKTLTNITGSAKVGQQAALGAKAGAIGVGLNAGLGQNKSNTPNFKNLTTVKPTTQDSKIASTINFE